MYLGSTSYSAVFTEGQSHPQLKALPDSDCEDSIAACQEKLKLGLSPSILQEGADVLNLLSDIEMYQPGLSRWYKVQCIATLTPFVAACTNMVRQTMEGTAQSITSLHMLSEKTFISTSRDLTFQSTTVLQDLPSMLMGENLRWDTVGLILTVAGLSAITLDEVFIDEDEDSNPNADWKEMARKLLIAGGKCISFCEKVDSLTDVTVWLTTMNYILHTQVEGDAGKSSFKVDGRKFT